MKIAIQGHPTRGKEVARILKSLGGKNLTDHTFAYKDLWYYLDSDNFIICSLVIPMGYREFTLEEFKKEFPFKIGDEVMFPVTKGWLSGKITGIKDFEYEVDTRIGGYRYVEPYKLQLYPMKEERNITLTLEKAKEWYNKGGELKEIALQAFSEKELNPLPRSWEEFITNRSISGYYISGDEKPLACCSSGKFSSPHVCLSKKSVEAHLAMIQLEQLRNCWWNGWEPEYNCGTKYIIKWDKDDLIVATSGRIRAFLIFPTREMAEEFLKCFIDLIEKAGDLI